MKVISLITVNILWFNILIYSITLDSSVKVIKPSSVIEAKANVMDMVINDNRIYIATDKGIIEIFNLKNNKKLYEIKLAKVKNYYNEFYSPKIYSLDVLDNKILIISEGSLGNRDISIYDNNTLNKVKINSDFMTSKARFINENQIFLALMSNDIILYNTNENKVMYKKHLSNSIFTDFKLYKNKVALTNESGNIILINVENGKIIKKFTNVNVDKVNKIDFIANYIVTGGHDRRFYIINLMNNKIKRENANFIVYAVSISPKLNYTAFSYNEENDILIINLHNGKKLYKLSGHYSPPNNIIFIDETTIISSADNSKILIWRFK
ncbi:MAG: hypothetical protein OEV44_07040 [Spirochaetota bacterium]|nr:hypothetical protein [Spirochaetota bacterium]